MITVTISKGATSYELTNYLGRRLVLKNSLEIRESEYGDNYAPTINTASFKMLFASVPAALLSERDVEISIVEDDDPIFTGYVRPLSSLELRRNGVGDQITVECEGCLSRLSAIHEGEAVDLGSDLVVFDPASPGASYVHQVLSRMSWTRGIAGPALTRAKPIALLRDGDKLLDKIADALRSCGHYLTEAADGSLVVKPFVVASPVSTIDYSVAQKNIIGDLSLNRSEPDETAIALTYGKYNRIPEYALLAVDVKHVIYMRYYANPCDRKAFVWPYNLDAEGQPPHLYSTTDNDGWVWDARYGVIQKKLDSSGNETSEEDILIALPDPDVSGLVAGLWRYANLRAELTFTDKCVVGVGWVGSWRKSGTIKVRINSAGTISYYRVVNGVEQALEADHPLQGCVQASWEVSGLNLKIVPAGYVTNDQHNIYFEGYSVYGVLDYIHSNPDATLDADAPRLIVGDGTRKDVSMENCLQPADAEGIAKALLVQLDCPVASFRTDTGSTGGAIVTVKREGRGVDILGRITARTYNPETKGKRYSLKVEGLESLTIEGSYLPDIAPGRGAGQGASQSVAELISSRARQAAAEAAAEEAALAAVTEKPSSLKMLSHFSFDDISSLATKVIDNSGNGNDVAMVGFAPAEGRFAKGAKIGSSWLEEYANPDLSSGFTFGKFFAVLDANAAHAELLSQFAFDIVLTNGKHYRYEADELPNKWHAMVVRHADGVLSIWYDSELVDEITCTHEEIVHIIAGATPAAAMGTDGQECVDEFTNYLRPLSDAEIRGFCALGVGKSTSWSDILDEYAANGWITPQEKPGILAWYAQINGDGATTGSYWTLRAAAIALGVDTAGLDAAFDALAVFLYESPGIVAEGSWSEPIEISQAAWQTVRSEYFTAESAQVAENTRVSVKTTTIENTPVYWGPFEYPLSPAGAKDGHKILWFSQDAGDQYRGVFKYDSSQENPWVRTVDAVDIRPALRDIVGIVKIKDSAGNYLYGAETDYGVTESMSVAHIISLIVDYLEGGEATFSGKLKAAIGEFVGALAAPEIHTEQAQTPGIIAPAGSHWMGSSLIAHCAGLAEGSYAASGTFGGKTASAAAKGSSYQVAYQSDDAAEYDSGYQDWKTLKSITSKVSGRVMLYCQAKAGSTILDTYHRILLNGVVVASLTTKSTSWKEMIAYVTLKAGDVVEYQGKSQYAMFWQSAYHCQYLRICPVSGTIGVGYSDSTWLVVEPGTYYGLAGSIAITGLANFVVSAQSLYWLGSALYDLLAAAGASVWFENELEADGWSNTYNDVIANRIVGKSCFKYKLTANGVLISYSDNTTGEILVDRYYAYSASDALYPQSRNGSVYLGEHRFREDADPNIMRVSNRKSQSGNAHYTVISNDAPRVDSNPAARFESTWAKLIEWWDGVYHAFVHDDSLHNLVETTLDTETLSIDASAKTITRSTNAWDEAHIGPGEMLKLRGFAGAYAANNGYYHITRMAGAVLYYDTTLLAVPVSCSAYSGATVGYPPRLISGLLNFGATAETHKPRIMCGYQKGSGEFEYAYMVAMATKRIKFYGGIKPAGRLHGSYTFGSMFLTLSAVLIYIGETLDLRGAMSISGGSAVPVSGCEFINATTVRVYGLAGNTPTTFDLASGSATTIYASISW